MAKLAIILVATLALLACTAPQAAEKGDASTPSPQPVAPSNAPPSLLGRWTIVAVNGAPAPISPDRSPVACGADGQGLANFFTGDVFAAIGPNRDVALFVNRLVSLTARPVP